MRKSTWSEKKSKEWFYFVREIQNFFLEAGFCPVETPVLVKSPGTEEQIQFFSTVRIKNGKETKVWLASSPEMHLKKLLCRGLGNIFEIHKSFRNDEDGPLNLNEFYLLEWYRARAKPRLLIEDLKNLILRLKNKGFISFPLKPFKRYTVRELFSRYCGGFDLTVGAEAFDLAPVLKKYSIPFNSAWPFEDLFHLLFLNRIEKNLDPDTPIIIDEYPPLLRAYAKLTDEGWADRFEFYWRGFELANAFHEVHSPLEMEKIFEQNLRRRKEKLYREGKKNLHLEEGLTGDTELIEEMKDKMPPCSGIALGLERFFMAAKGYKDIKEIHPF